MLIVTNFGVFGGVLLGHCYSCLGIGQACFDAFAAAGNHEALLFRIGHQEFCILGLNSSCYAFVAGWLVDVPPEVRSWSSWTWPLEL